MFGSKLESNLWRCGPKPYPELHTLESYTATKALLLQTSSTVNASSRQPASKSLFQLPGGTRWTGPPGPPQQTSRPQLSPPFAPPFPPIDCRELPPDRPSPAPICSVSNRKIVSRLLNCQILRCIRKSRQTLTFPLEAISFFPIPHPNLDHALPLNRIAATSPPCPSSRP
jgi:hypothetical protein